MSNSAYRRLKSSVEMYLSRAYGDNDESDYCTFCGSNRDVQHALNCPIRHLTNALQAADAQAQQEEIVNAEMRPPVISSPVNHFPGNDVHYLVPTEVLKMLVENPRVKSIEITAGEVIIYNIGLGDAAPVVTATLEVTAEQTVTFLPTALVHRLSNYLETYSATRFQIVRLREERYNPDEYPGTIICFDESGQFYPSPPPIIVRGYVLRIMPSTVMPLDNLMVLYIIGELP